MKNNKSKNIWKLDPKIRTLYIQTLLATARFILYIFLFFLPVLSSRHLVLWMSYVPHTWTKATDKTWTSPLHFLFGLPSPITDGLKNDFPTQCYASQKKNVHDDTYATHIDEPKWNDAHEMQLANDIARRKRGVWFSSSVFASVLFSQSFCFITLSFFSIWFDFIPFFSIIRSALLCTVLCFAYSDRFDSLSSTVIPLVIPRLVNDVSEMEWGIFASLLMAAFLFDFETRILLQIWTLQCRCLLFPAHFAFAIALWASSASGF